MCAGVIISACMKRYARAERFVIILEGNADGMARSAEVERKSAEIFVLPTARVVSMKSVMTESVVRRIVAMRIMSARTLRVVLTVRVVIPGMGSAERVARVGSSYAMGNVLMGVCVARMSRVTMG